MNKGLTIFGREPAAWVGLIESVLVLLMAFALGVDQTTFGPIMAVVSALAGAYTAWATRDTMLGYIVGLVKAVIGLTAVYGLTLTDTQVGAIMAATAMGIGFFQRTQTTPVANPQDPSPTQVVPSKGRAAMSESLRFRVKVDAAGEVRDTDGNLVSTEPVSATMELTAAELESLGLPVPPHPNEEK